MTTRGHILIPSAATIPAEMALEFGHLPSVMVPLRGQPALDHITRPLFAQNWQAWIGYGERGQLITDHIAANADAPVTPVSCDQSHSLGESVLRLLQALPDDNLPVIINFGDTLIGDMDDATSSIPAHIGSDFIAFKQVDETWRWTSFRVTPTGQLKSIQDKLTAPAQEGKTTIFVGLFGIQDAAAFRRILIDHLKGDAQSGTDPFYQALMTWFNQLPPDPTRLVECNAWYDLGHIDNYNQARRSIFMNQRFFNDVTVDDARGVLTKRSRNTGKFIDEIRWYLKLPRSLEHAAPRIFDYSLDVDSPFVEMEFYGYPVLSDLFLYSDLDPGVWERILGAIHQLLCQFAEHRFVPKTPGKIRQILGKMYIDKSLTRIAKYQSDPGFSLFHRDNLTINGQPVLSLDEIVKRLPGVVDDVLLASPPELGVIHGDLCLGNILYDRRNGIARIIDPRGNFGGLDIYGDPNYDLAKLGHSFLGHYDHMVHDRVDWSHTGPAISWAPQMTETQKIISTMFAHFLNRHYADRMRQIQLIEALLFLSMVPLHQDRPRAQKAMISRGMSLFSEIANGLGARS